MILPLAFAVSLPFAGRAQLYSRNVIGYVDVNLVAGSNLVANPLFSSDNSVSNLFRWLPDGAVFLPCSHGSSSIGPTNRFSAGTGWSSPGATFTMPDAAFLVLPTATKITFIGQPWILMNGAACLTYPFAESFSGWWPKSICGFCGFGGECPPYPDGLLVQLWNPATQSYGPEYQYVSQVGWWPSEPVVPEGQAVRFFSPTTFNARGPASSLGGGTVPTRLPWAELRRPLRTATNLMLECGGTSSFNYAVFASTNLHTIRWQQVTQGTAIPANGWASLSVNDTNSRAYYRVLPQFGDLPELLGGHRGTDSFGFQFYAPSNATYRIDRTAALNTTWQQIQSIDVSAGTIVGVTDASATGPTAYYRIRY